MESEKRHEIFINDKKFEVFEEKMTGSQIKALANIPPGNRLFLEVPGKVRPDKPIADTEIVEMKSGERFYDLPVGQVGVNRTIGRMSF